MEENKSRVYILVDSENRVTRLEGEYTLPSDLSGWILLEDGQPCDRLNLAQTHYLEKPLTDDRGIYQYKYIDARLLERTKEEMDSDYVEPIPTPSQLDTIEAQVMYTALMTDTLIEE